MLVTRGASCQCANKLIQFCIFGSVNPLKSTNAHARHTLIYASRKVHASPPYVRVFEECPFGDIHSRFMRHTEPLLNYVLAEALRERHPRWNEKDIVAENTDTLKEKASFHPDILIDIPGSAPVCIEAEKSPGRSVDEDAEGRLGKRLKANGDEVESVIALIYPEHAPEASLSEIANYEFQIAVHTRTPEGPDHRYPRRGYVTSDINLLSSVIERLCISESAVIRNTERLIDTINEGHSRISREGGDSVSRELGKVLHQSHGEQTNKMTCAILSSAMVFHIAIEDQEGVPSVLSPENVSKGQLMDIWTDILEVNYYPIFHIAQELLNVIPTILANRLMKDISVSVSPIASDSASSYQGLCGKMFQKLITDRKLLATFYTLPTSACLLAEMAVERLPVDWSSSREVQRLRIGDFACGTGALLSASQASLYDRVRLYGGDDSALHREVMESVMTGLDIMPAATHLTSAILSSIHPQIPYHESQIITMPFGTRDTEGGGISIGSLDFLKGEEQGYLFGGGVRRVQASWGKDKQYDLPVDEFNLVIMNPPFTRNCGQEGKKKGIPRPAFAAFNTSRGEQAAMARELKNYDSNAGHGGAGPASNFIDLADTRIKSDGGVLALVLPFTFACGASWQKARSLLKKKYRDVHIFAIAHEKVAIRSFSDSTGIAECLVIGTKRSSREIVDNEAKEPETCTIRSTTLCERPNSLYEAVVLARNKKWGGGRATCYLYCLGQNTRVWSPFFRSHRVWKYDR